MSQPDNTRLLEIATQLRAQRPADLPEADDDEIMEMAQWVLDSEGLSDDDIEQILRDVDLREDLDE